MNPKSNNTNLASMSDTAIVKDICSSLKQMRLNKNISQVTLAETTGISRITISRMESGRAATLLTFVQLLRGLGELDRLNSFKVSPLVSPLKMLKITEHQRQKASSKRKSINKRKQKSK